jgi:hypothetical protein
MNEKTKTKPVTKEEEIDEQARKEIEEAESCRTKRQQRQQRRQRLWTMPQQRLLVAPAG